MTREEIEGKLARAIDSALQKFVGEIANKDTALAIKEEAIDAVNKAWEEIPMIYTDEYCIPRLWPIVTITGNEVCIELVPFHERDKYE